VLVLRARGSRSGETFPRVLFAAARLSRILGQRAGTRVPGDDPAVKISIDQAPGWVKNLEGELHRAALKGVRSAGQRLVSHIQTEVIPAEARVPVDRGIYKAAWRSTPDPNGCTVHNDSPHAGFIEDGVRGKNVKIGRKLIDALVDWVQRKGLTRDVSRNSKTAAARQIAWGIAKSMQQRGIFNEGSGLKILEKGRRRVVSFIEDEVRAEIEKIRR
jgi:hypothetical protein